MITTNLVENLLKRTKFHMFSYLEKRAWKSEFGLENNIVVVMYYHINEIVIFYAFLLNDPLNVRWQFDSFSDFSDLYLVQKLILSISL